MPLAKVRQLPPSSSPIADSSSRRVKLCGRPYESTPATTPLAGSSGKVDANTGPGRNGCPGPGRGRPAWTLRVESPYIAMILFGLGLAAHQRGHGHGRCDTFMAHQFDLFGDWHLHPAPMCQIADG